MILSLTDTASLNNQSLDMNLVVFVCVYAIDWSDASFFSFLNKHKLFVQNSVNRDWLNVNIFAILRQFLSKIFSSYIPFSLVTCFKYTYLLMSVSLKNYTKYTWKIYKILRKLVFANFLRYLLNPGIVRFYLYFYLIYFKQ